MATINNFDIHCISDAASKMPPCEGSVILESAGGDESLVFDGTNLPLVIKGLTAGAGVTLIDNGTDVEI